MQLTVAGERADIIKKKKEQADTLSPESAPGALMVEKDWTRWYDAFENMLNTMFGVFNVPLSYVIRELESPTEGATFTAFVGRFCEVNCSWVHLNHRFQSLEC